MHHRRGLRRLLKDDELVAEIEAGWRAARLDARRRAILEYAVKLTRSPAAITREDVDALRAQGLDDADVLAVCEVTAYYAYANRIADGLGIELEDDGAREE